MRPSAKLAELLTEKGWSMTQLAKRSGLSQRTTHRMCTQSYDSVRNALAIAAALGTTADWLWSDAPWSERPQLPGIDVSHLVREPASRVLKKLRKAPGGEVPAKKKRAKVRQLRIVRSTKSQPEPEAQ